MITQFILDGETYNVQVMSLRRSFEIKESIAAKLTQNGDIYRDLIGTYYNYTITVREKEGDREALDAFWDAVSSPDPSHECIFPYNQTVLAQKMYVKTGNQEISCLHKDGATWKDITVQFIAKEPKVII